MRRLSAHAGDVGIHAGRDRRNVPESAGCRETGEVSALGGRYVQERRLPLAVNRGYSVTAALIERVQRGDWDPDHHDDDRQSRDALAARGYWQAFQKVKETVAK